jgi:hypothetical protein
MYERCLEVIARTPEEVCMVAAHAYDLRAAAKLFVKRKISVIRAD